MPLRPQPEEGAQTGSTPNVLWLRAPVPKARAAQSGASWFETRRCPRPCRITLSLDCGAPHH